MLWISMVCLLAGLSPLPASSQESALIREGNPRGETQIGSLNPLLCTNPGCEGITRLLFPTLLHVDPATRAFAPATSDSGLALSWDIDAASITYRLRQDRLWSDGTPITAQDVDFSYRAIASRQIGSPYERAVTDLIASAEVIDTATIRFNLTDSTCAALDVTNIPIIPAHVFTEGAGIAAFDFAALRRHPFNTEPTVTAGAFRFYERRYADSIRLLSPDGTVAYEFADTASPDRAVDQFLRGELNLLVDPPYERRRDLRAADNVTEFTSPGSQWYHIALNQADAAHPRSYVDRAGAPLEQGNHRLFGDVRVRRALQMAIDVPALIEAALEGDGVPLASSPPLLAWALNGDLVPVPYDPVGAAALLREAGWRDLNRDGILECFDCLYAEQGEPFQFELIYFDGALQGSAQPSVNTSVVANLLTQQLRLVGVSLFVTGYPQGDPAGIERILGQQFDALLFGVEDTLQIDAEWYEWLRTEEDILDTGFNFISYHRPEVDERLQQALTVPGCTVDARRAIYADLQAFLQEDVPFIALFSPLRATFARDDGLRFPALAAE